MADELTNLLGTLGVQYPDAPAPTPALLAYLRGVGLNLSTAEDVRRKAIARIGSATADATADIDRTAGRSKTNVTADLIRRGVLSSGESNTRYARLDEDVGAKRADVARAGAAGIEQAETGYRSSADLARQQALERVIGVETDQTLARATSEAQEAAYERQRVASDEAWERERKAQDEAWARQEALTREMAAKGIG